MNATDLLLVAMFGFASIFVLVLSFCMRGEDRTDAVIFASILLMSWALSNLGWLSDNPLRTNSVIDGCTLAFCIAWWGPRVDGWRLAFMIVTGLQLLIDIYRELTIPNFTLWASVLNATFALQLVIVALGALPAHVRDHLCRSNRDASHPPRSKRP